MNMILFFVSLLCIQCVFPQWMSSTFSSIYKLLPNRSTGHIKYQYYYEIDPCIMRILYVRIVSIWRPKWKIATCRKKSNIKLAFYLCQPHVKHRFALENHPRACLMRGYSILDTRSFGARYVLTRYLIHSPH